MHIKLVLGFLFNGHRVRVFAPICTADAPARPKLRNTKQFNGVCGCDWCLHAGMYTFEYCIGMLAGFLINQGNKVLQIL
jgi:hypothetical protein